MNPTFQGEVMLAGWSETHNGGAKVAFWLPDAGELDTFRGLTIAKGKTAGQRFMCVLVEIGDDEAPKDAKAERDVTEAARLGPLALLACRWCRSAAFREWIRELGRTPGPDIGEARAREWILKMCDVMSRREIDKLPTAAEGFQKHIREPFMKWLAETGQSV